MGSLTAVCGLSCNECEAYIATQNNDDNARREVAEKWSVRYNADIKPENINCQGCMSDDDCKFMFCNYCEMRKCAVEKNYATCGHCPDYPCKIIAGFFTNAPEMKVALDKIKSGL